MSNQPASVVSTIGTSSPRGWQDKQQDAHKVVYWHRELPPLHAEPLEEHTVEANSMRVTGSLAHRGDLWDQCYRDLMARAEDRLCQEVRRLGGDFAHVLQETVDSRRDDCSGDVWLHCRLEYMLLRRPAAP